MDIRIEGETLVIELVTDLVASVVKDNLKDAKESIENSTEFDNVLLDISNIEHIDSIGVTFIVGLYKTSLEHNKTFKVTGANENIANLFRLMSLDEVFSIE